MKKILCVVILFSLSIFLVGCSFDNKKESDSLKFKSEYESLNGTIREKDGRKIRSISIDENNPMVYKDASDIVNMINNKESFVVYFGFSDCPWCRSMISTLIDVANELKMGKVYYVDVSELRDEIKIDSSGNMTTVYEGTDDYYDLLRLLDSVLEDYTIINENNEEVLTGEKRIYAPSVVAVVDGEAKQLKTGISDKQTDAYMELTDEMHEDTYNQLKDLMNCVLDSENTCATKNGC